jgi:hypothetical protein
MPARAESVDRYKEMEHIGRRPAIDPRTGRRVGTWFSGRALDERLDMIQDQQRRSGDEIFNVSQIMSEVPTRGRGRHQTRWR